MLVNTTISSMAVSYTHLDVYKRQVLDRVHGAGCPGTVLVGGAGVVHMTAAHAPGQSLSGT